MKFRDISNDTETTYTLQKNEACVFFMLNRSGDITFDLKGEGSTAHVFSFFIGKNDDEGSLVIHQKHLAPKTTSQAIVKSILSDSAKFSYRGSIHIEKTASLSDASQENRNLLLSGEARAFSEPALEILTSDVKCHHASTTSPLDKEMLFFATTRGLSPKSARELLVSGFLQSSLDTLHTLTHLSEETEENLSNRIQVDVSALIK
jgi:Fe-S cluster assembly protein SufD